MDVPYLRRVLIPFWVIQLIFIIISLGDSAYLLSVYAQGQTENGTCGDYYNGYYDCSVTVTAPPILLAFYGLVVAFSIVSIALIVTEIVLYARQRLPAKIYFAFQLTNVLLWTVLFAMCINGIVVGYDSILIIVSVIISWVAMIGALIYSSVMFHRYQVKGSGFGAGYGNGYNPGGHAVAA
ncbi:hypothetical protein MMC34_004488 [Xylographa carneopallida]|nr:hypothetical protein [Xylographa carneopallida]